MEDVDSQHIVTPDHWRAYLAKAHTHQLVNHLRLLRECQLMHPDWFAAGVEDIRTEISTRIHNGEFHNR